MPHRRDSVALLVTLAAGLTAAPSPAADDAPSWDALFRMLPQPANIKENMRRLSARPHHVGSAYDKDNAFWLLARFREYGWQAEIETFDVLFPTPKTRQLEMQEPTRYVARLEEPAVEGDPTSSQKAEQLPTYNAYSRDGDVTAPLVYVNYGRREDYEVLDRYGISVKGAIVIARYGMSWRGIKPKVAAERGAIGCIIYSDPGNDGYGVDQVFPDGPMRNANGVQRGSVMDMPTHAGDPLTPGIAATPDAKRLALADVQTLTKIPVQPISSGDAQPLLAALKGPVAPSGWRGGLPLTYHLGPGPAKVHLKLAFHWDTKTIYDVIARIPGGTYPDEWILRGNHHDAWVNGAWDPVSGMASMLEEARALGDLRKRGWTPKRTIVYTAWDGEEPMLLGSSEWVEQHEAELGKHAVLYVNSDSNGRGYLDADGSHTLEKFVNALARDVEDPEAKVSVWKRWQAARIVSGSDEQKKEARERPDLRIGALGSGSDYTPFLQHGGVAVLNLGYDGEDDSGIYHSIYDDFYWYSHFADVDFVYGRALAQTAGSAVIRAADADVLPFEFTSLADTVRTYLDDLRKLLKSKQETARERNRNLDEGVLLAVIDPRRPQVVPPREDVPPALNFAPIENAATRLEVAAKRYAQALEASRSMLASRVDVIRSVNARLMQAERQLTDPDGLPRRPWYRHLLYAPGFYTGYAVKTMPGVREGIEDKEYTQAEAEAVRLAKAIERVAQLAEGAAAELEAAHETSGSAR
jgi:N-acetylated-alpha-linked acidic dipeptidase